MYGLVLEGGGAKGSYHVGAYKALLEEGIPVSAVVGTSIGALNGAMIVQGDFDVCQKLWEDISYSKLMGESDEEIERLAHTKLGREELTLLAQRLKSLIAEKGFDISPFRRMLDKYVDEDRIRASSMDFGLVAFNLSDLKPVQLFKEQIPEGEMKNHLLASSYLPIFRMERLNGKLYMDGGVYDNLPFRMLIDKGYSDLVIVRTHINAKTRELLPEGINAIVVEPSEDIGRSFTYEKSIVKHNIKLGYFDAMKQIKGLKGSSFYFWPKGEKHYFDFFSRMNEDTIEELSDLLGIQGKPTLRMIFDELLPRIGKALDMNQENSYEDLAIFLLERLMLLSGRNRFEIYDFEDAASNVSLISKESLHKDSGRLLKLKERLEFLSPFNREELLVQIARLIFNKTDVWRGDSGYK